MTPRLESDHPELDANTLDYVHFLADSPSPYHAAHLVAQRLENLGFSRQDETAAWDATPGGHVLVRGGAVMAWVVPENISDTAGFRIVGAHTDSPAFTLKPSPQTTTADGWGQIEVEVYGGMIMNSWLDRELSVAGRLILASGEEILVRTAPLARIPQLAIHLNRGVNESLHLDPQKHLHPVWTVDTPDASLMDTIAQAAGLDNANDVVSFDLICIPSQGPATFGADSQFVASGRQDNLSSVHPGLCALEDLARQGLPSDGDILVFSCFDHEEIGSEPRSGAAGPFLEDVLVRLSQARGESQDEYRRSLADSVCLSADAGHLVNPNYQGHHDPTVRPLPGAGPLLKINANQRYATDAVGAGIFAAACKAARVPYQEFVSNNNMPCGSTIGPITATRLGMRTVDVGVGLLSMHSAREMCHVHDMAYLTRAVEGFYRLQGL